MQFQEVAWSLLSTVHLRAFPLVCHSIISLEFWFKGCTSNALHVAKLKMSKIALQACLRVRSRC